MTRYIDEQRITFGVEPTCRALAIPPSPYYAARSRSPSGRAVRDAALKADIGRIHRGNFAVYGARKLWHALRREGTAVGRDQVGRLMRRLGLRGALRGKTRAPRAERNVSPECGPRAGASSGYPVLPWPHAQSRGNRSVRSVVYAVPTQEIDQGQRPGCWSTRRETGTMTHNTIPGALRPLLGLLVIGLVAIGCTSANAKAPEMGASCDQFGAQKSITQTTEMSVGDQIKVTLCSNPSTGFSWQEPEISDTGAVSLADKSFGAPTSASAPVVGAAGTAYITLKATAKGTSTVVLRYSQPWLGGTSSEWTYTLTVTVR